MPVTYPSNSLDETARMMVAVMKQQAMRRLEIGVRAGCDWMCEVLKQVVGGPSGQEQPTGRPEIYYVDERGRKVARNKAAKWTGAAFARTGPPGKDTGAGQASIHFEIVERNFEKLTITARIGVDGTAAGGTRQLGSYMLIQELGYRIPTLGPDKGTGPVVQRPWLRTTINRYLPELSMIVVMTQVGLR